VDARIRVDALRDALGHKSLQMTSRYISRQNDPVRELAKRVGSQIHALTGPKTQNVVANIKSKS
jgi:integrase